MTEQPEIPPALTPDEWRDGYDSKELSIRQKSAGLDGSKRLAVYVRAWPLGGSMGDPRDLYALAALCLYGQPFGFTQEEANALCACLPDEPNAYEESCSPDATTLDAAWRAVQKIRALLPPRS